MQTHSANSATLTVACPVGSVLLGGGARRGSTQNILASYPVRAATTGTTAGTTPADGEVPNGWTVIFSAANGGNAVFAVCSP